MRKALVVGINYYDHVSSLFGCVNDAHSAKDVLERHGDGSVNFDVRFLTGTGANATVSRAGLKDAIGELFKDDSDIALFYFAGHGYIEAVGGYLATSDSARGDEGVSLTEVLQFANDSKAKNRIVVLDSCYSGIAGTSFFVRQSAVLSEGLTILTACTQDQYATEENGRGLFTTLFVDALNGAAANLVGDISPGSVYAYIDQSLGSWEQRPLFKTNVKEFVSLRKVQPPIELANLQRITEFFPTPDFQYPLDPSYEPELRGRSAGMPSPNPENTQKFSILQKFNRINLVVPVDAPHMWHAAMESKSCKLTVLGEHYRRLVKNKRI
jgi:hypothetical protein